jgi:hypothetical protein
LVKAVRSSPERPHRRWRRRGGQGPGRGRWRREAFANDLGVLRYSAGSVNQAKSGHDPGTWRPSDPRACCMGAAGEASRSGGLSADRQRPTLAAILAAWLTPLCLGVEQGIRRVGGPCRAGRPGGRSGTGGRHPPGVGGRCWPKPPAARQPNTDPGDLATWRAGTRRSTLTGHRCTCRRRQTRAELAAAVPRPGRSRPAKRLDRYRGRAP